MAKLEERMKENYGRVLTYKCDIEDFTELCISCTHSCERYFLEGIELTLVEQSHYDVLKAELEG